MTKLNTKVLVLWHSDQDGYGTDLHVFSGDAGLLDHLRETLRASEVPGDEIERVVESSMMALVDGGVWDYDGHRDSDCPELEGTHFKAKWCAVGG